MRRILSVYPRGRCLGRLAIHEKETKKKAMNDQYYSSFQESDDDHRPPPFPPSQQSYPKPWRHEMPRFCTGSFLNEGKE